MKGELKEIIKENRQANYDISALILNRYSPRALSGEELTDEELFPLFEAARWAPSAFNNQPWRFIVAKRQDADSFKKLLDLLTEPNQAWCKNASALVVVASAKNFEYNGKPTDTSGFDTGSAWENLALEATHREIIAHGMSGFDKERARIECRVPEDFHIHAMIAIGKLGNKEDLPEEVQKGETPNNRRPLSEIVFNGTFGTEMKGLK